METVKVYGADWCSMTHRTLEFLTRREIPHEYIDVEKDPKASEWVKQQNGGKEIKPTVEIGRRVLSAPSNAELDEAVGR